MMTVSEDAARCVHLQARCPGSSAPSDHRRPDYGAFGTFQTAAGSSVAEAAAAESYFPGTSSAVASFHRIGHLLRLSHHMLHMADALSEGIIKQFPQKF